LANWRQELVVDSIRQSEIVLPYVNQTVNDGVAHSKI